MRQAMREAIDFMGIADADTALADRYGAVFAELLPGVIAAFYAHLSAVGHAGLLDGVDVAQLKRRQLDHWRRLFAAGFDDAYADHVTRIGVVHRERSITPKLYIQSYGWFTSRLVEALVDHPQVAPADRAPLAGTVLKLVHLDMTLALVGYEAALID